MLKTERESCNPLQCIRPLSARHTVSTAFCSTLSLSPNIVHFFAFFQTKNKSKALQAPVQLGQACP